MPDVIRRAYAKVRELTQFHVRAAGRLLHVPVHAGLDPDVVCNAVLSIPGHYHYSGILLCTFLHLLFQKQPTVQQYPQSVPGEDGVCIHGPGKVRTIPCPVPENSVLYHDDPGGIGGRSCNTALCV